VSLLSTLPTKCKGIKLIKVEECNRTELKTRLFLTKASEQVLLLMMLKDY